MISCSELSVRFGDRCLFKDVQLNLLTNQRYVIVGPNGSGKSTFLKVLAGEEHASEGNVEKPNGITIGLLKQDHFRYKDHRVIDVVIEGKPALANAIKEKAHILAKENFTEEDGYRLGELEEIILVNDGYQAETQAQTLLLGLGIAPQAHDGPLSALSGGYKLRVLLAQALFQNPHALLLDEPTNHLDILSITWLENFLINNYKGLLIVISHDRSFINNIATHILDIDYATITCYPDNYDKFLIKKEAILEQKQQELTSKQQQIEHLQAYVDKFRASAARAKQAQSKMKMIDRIELPEIARSSHVTPHFKFHQKKPTGKKTLDIKGLTKSYPHKTLFKNINWILNRGQKCALIGPNGVGKSTLLKILLNQIEAEAGNFQWNESASIGYFSQDFHELLDPKLNLIDWLNTQVRNVTDSEIRKTLGQMLFSGDAVYKKIGVLSGGECARLVFAKLLLEQHNVLILDEPTNHLDLESTDSLAEGIKHFPGTVICVSHNRYFVQQIASALLVITPKKVDVYPGTYDDYLAKMGKDYLLRIYETTIS